MGAVGFVEYEFLRARINGIVDSFESRRFKDSLFLMHTPDEVDSYNAKQLWKLNLLGSHVMSFIVVKQLKNGVETYDGTTIFLMHNEGI